MHLIFSMHYLLSRNIQVLMQLKSNYRSGDNMTSPVLNKKFIMSRILFFVHLIYFGNYRNSE